MADDRQPKEVEPPVPCSGRLSPQALSETREKFRAAWKLPPGKKFVRQLTPNGPRWTVLTDAEIATRRVVRRAGYWIEVSASPTRETR
jgi:hypothetical protein